MIPPRPPKINPRRYVWWARYTVRVLSGLVCHPAADPDQRLSELPLLTEAERRQVLVEWSGPRTAYPRDRCVHELFEEQAARTPDAAAVACDREQLSYADLNRRASNRRRVIRRQRRHHPSYRANE